MWKWETRTAVQIISASVTPIKSLASDASGEYVFVGSLDAKVYKVHLRLGRVENVIASLGTRISILILTFSF